MRRLAGRRQTDAVAGWAPEDNLQEISDYLESKTVYFDVADPTPDDDVPIKFKTTGSHGS